MSHLILVLSQQKYLKLLLTSDKSIVIGNCIYVHSVVATDISGSLMSKSVPYCCLFP